MISSNFFALTMAHNEFENLPRWVSYYGRNFGLGNIFVIDHGSNDGSVDKLPSAVNVIRIRHSIFDDTQRLRLIEGIFNGLLAYFSCGIYADCDEFVIPDPKLYSSLNHYCKILSIKSVCAIGINIVDIKSKDAAYNPHKSILDQRNIGIVVNSMCKPLISQSNISWNPGFHTSNIKPFVDPNLYLFHAKYAFRERALSRLEYTRDNLIWSDFALDKGQGRHQRWSDEELESRFDSYDRRFRSKQLTEFDFSHEATLAVAGAWQNKKGMWVRSTKFEERMIEIPDRFGVSGV